MRTAIALGGLVAAVGGGLLLATSDHLVDPVPFGTQLASWSSGPWRRPSSGSSGAPGTASARCCWPLPSSLRGWHSKVRTTRSSTASAWRSSPLFFLLGYLVVFASPEGRTGRAERLLLAGMALYFLVAFVPWLFFSPVVSGGGPLFGCNSSCPAQRPDDRRPPGLAASFGSDMAWAVIALLTATVVLLAVRLATSSRPRRRTLLPVYVPALVLSVALLGFHGFAAGVLHLDADTLSDLGWTVTVARVAMPFGFLLAIAQASVFAGSALTRLMAQIGGNPGAARLRQIVAGALDDPSVELAFRVDGDDGFVDSRGKPTAGVTARDGRATSLVGRQGETVAAIWHDPALNTDPELVNAASQAVLLALENGRLDAELRTTTASSPPRAHGTRPSGPPSGAGSSATSTTARSSSWSRCRSRWRSRASSHRATRRSRRGWPMSGTGSRTS